MPTLVPPSNVIINELFSRRILTTVAPTEEVPEEQKEDTESSEPKDSDRKAPEQKNGKRRGYWKKVRVRPADTFETAESQHIGNHYLNSLLPEIKDMEKHRFDKDSDAEIKLNFDPDFKKVLPKDEDETEGVRPTAETELVREPKKTEQVEVISWSRDTTPQVVVTEMPKTERPEVSSVEVEELNKDDEAHNKSSEEDEFVTTVQPTAEASIELTTVPAPTRQTTEDASMFDEVKKSLTELFGMSDDDDDDDEPADQLALEDHEDREQKSYEQEDDSTTLAPTVESEVNGVTSTVKPIELEITTENGNEEQSSTQSPTTTEKPGANPMGSLILATSTSRHVSHETEICYRGRCIKTDKKKLEQ